MIEKDELVSLVPHRGRMFLLSRVKKYDLKDGYLEAEYDITENCLFYDPALEGVPSWVSFEFIAQAISALFGLKLREKGKKPKIGFIMSVSSMKAEIPFFGSGSTLEIKAKEINCIDMVYSFEGFIFLEGRMVFEGKLTVMEVEDDKMQLFQKEHKSID